jgi:hypothetical protein
MGAAAADEGCAHMQRKRSQNSEPGDDTQTASQQSYNFRKIRRNRKCGEEKKNRSQLSNGESPTAIRHGCPGARERLKNRILLVVYSIRNFCTQ